MYRHELPSRLINRWVALQSLTEIFGSGGNGKSFPLKVVVWCGAQGYSQNTRLIAIPSEITISPQPEYPRHRFEEVDLGPPCFDKPSYVLPPENVQRDGSESGRQRNSHSFLVLLEVSRGLGTQVFG